MKITIESTSEIVILEHFEGSEVLSIPARVWEGATESGVRVVCLIARIAVKDDQDCTQFEKELLEIKPPTMEAVRAFPLRLVL